MLVPPRSLLSCVQSCVSFSQVFSSSLAGLTVADVKFFLWTKQVTQGQGCCQHHRCCDFGELKVCLCWAAKLDIIIPVLSRTNQLPAGVVCCHGQWNMNQLDPVGNFHLLLEISQCYSLADVHVFLKVDVCCKISTTTLRNVWPPNKDH